MTEPTAPQSHQDNLFGICAAVGEDFGFNPNWLRVAFGVGLLFNLEGVIAAYFALGAIVLVSRLLVPVRRRTEGATITTLVPRVNETVDFKQAA